jgi:hypothetical protein
MNRAPAPPPQQKERRSHKSRKRKQQKPTVPKKLYCICEQENDPQRAMIQCSHCAQWFHFDCMDITNPHSQFQDEDFCCPACTHKLSDVYLGGGGDTKSRY